MPIVIRPVKNHLYQVYNKKTKVIHAKATTLKKAEAQKRLLNMLDH